MNDDLFALEIEPEAGPLEAAMEDARLNSTLPREPVVVHNAVLPPSEVVPVEENGDDAEAYPVTVALTRSLPDGFDLTTLLQFLPDVRLKADLDARANTALALKVTGREGVEKADAALGDLKARMKVIDLCFDGTEDAPGPTVLANQLHKRLTGLRADFKATGTSAVAGLSTAIARETKRLDDEAARAQRELQAIADFQARADTARAAEEARRSQAPAPLVAALEQAAKTATAPPVATHRAAAPVLAHSTVVEKQKARLLGTPEDDEPNPVHIKDLTKDQLDQVYKILRAIVAGEAPLSFIELNWPVINARAEGSALGEFLPGLEAYKARSTRGKGRR